MAPHKNFTVTYIFPEGDSVQIPVKAPKYPTDKMIARAVAKMQLDLPEGQGDGFTILQSVIELGSGKQPVTKVVWYLRDGNGGYTETLLYSFVVTQVL